MFALFVHKQNNWCVMLCMRWFSSIYRTPPRWVRSQHRVQVHLVAGQTIHIFYEKSLIIHRFQLYGIYEKQWFCPISWIILFLKCCLMFYESTTINNDFCVWIYSMHNNSHKIAVIHQAFKQTIWMRRSMNYWFWWILCSNNHSEFFIISVIHRKTYCTMVFIMFAKFYHLFFLIQWNDWFLIFWIKIIYLFL